jgi:hypothetical protein
LRTLVSLFLAGLLLACPLLCRAAESGCCHESLGAAGESQEDSHAPPSCPDDAVSCICAGATQADDCRAAALAPPHSLPFLDGLFFDLHPAFPVSDTRNPIPLEPPARLAAFGDALAVRAFLQNFRF